MILALNVEWARKIHKGMLYLATNIVTIGGKNGKLLDRYWNTFSYRIYSNHFLRKIKIPEVQDIVASVRLFSPEDAVFDARIAFIQINCSL